MRRIKCNTIVVCVAMLIHTRIHAQQVSLGNAIQIAQENSLDAKSARFSFQASYWTYRSFKAELLPSVNLSGWLMNYNRSLVETRNYDDGHLSYVSNNTLSNSLTLSVDQQIAATGMVGEYIAKIYTEVKRRPRYFIWEELK